MRMRPDGARRLVGPDGVAVTVEPALYRVPAAVMARLDAAVDRAHHVVMPARDGDRVPRVTLRLRRRALTYRVRRLRLRYRAMRARR